MYLSNKKKDVEKTRDTYFFFSVFIFKIKITLFGQSQSDLFTLYHSNGNCKEKENSKVIYEYSLTHFFRSTEITIVLRRKATTWRLRPRRPQWGRRAAVIQSQIQVSDSDHLQFFQQENNWQFLPWAKIMRRTSLLYTTVVILLWFCLKLFHGLAWIRWSLPNLLKTFTNSRFCKDQAEDKRLKVLLYLQLLTKMVNRLNLSDILVNFFAFEKNHNEKIKCKLSRSQIKWTGL